MYTSNRLVREISDYNNYAIQKSLSDAYHKATETQLMLTSLPTHALFDYFTNFDTDADNAALGSVMVL